MELLFVGAMTMLASLVLQAGIAFLLFKFP